MKVILSLAFFASLELIFAQEKNIDYCKTNFYNSKIVQYFSICDVKSLYSVDEKKIITLIREFNSEEIIKAISKIKNNSIFINLISKYAGTSQHDSLTLHAFSQQYKDSEDYKEYIENNNIIDHLITNTLKKNPEILNISLYSHFEEYGDCFFYQKGYDDFNFIMISSPIIISVLYGFNEFEIKNYNHNLVGVELREIGQIITIPIVFKNDYICDVRIMICR